MKLKVNGKEVENIKQNSYTEEVKAIILPILFPILIISKKTMTDNLEILKQMFSDFCKINPKTFVLENSEDEDDIFEEEDEEEEDNFVSKPKKKKIKNPYNYIQMNYLDEFLRLFEWIEFLIENTKEENFELDIQEEFSTSIIFYSTMADFLGDLRKTSLISFETLVKGYTYKSLQTNESKSIKSIGFILKNNLQGIMFHNPYETIELNKLSIYRQCGVFKFDKKENIVLSKEYFKKYAMLKLAILADKFPKITFLIDEITDDNLKNYEINFAWYINSTDVIKLQKKNVFLFVTVQTKTKTEDYCVIDIKQNLSKFINKLKKDNVEETIMFATYLDGNPVFEYNCQTNSVQSYDKKYDKLELDIKSIRIMEDELIFMEKI